VTAAGDGTPRRLERPGGHWLALRDWPLPPGPALRGQVLLVHGLGEHAGRYAKVVEHLHAWGFAACGYDHFGHGQSSGRRGDLPEGDRLLTDLAAVIDDVRGRGAPGLPLILLGHSLGGLVAARFVSLALRPIDALVLSSPALDAGLSALQQALAQVLGRLAPHVRVGNGIDPHGLSRDAASVQAYVADPLVHDRGSARLVGWLAAASREVIAAADRLAVDTLLLVAGDDALVAPAGSRRFADRAPAGRVTLHWYDELWHEVFNERAEDRARVLADLDAWLAARSPAFTDGRMAAT